MTGPNDPQYPGPQDPQYPQVSGQYPSGPYPDYPGQQYPPQPAPQRLRLSPRVLDRLGQRPAPRLGVSLAGVGVGLAIVGVVVWGSAYIADGAIANLVSGGNGGSNSRHYLGAVIAFIVVVIGYTLAIRAQRGPLATAGIAASALGVPVGVEFLLLDLSSSDPINTDAVVWISIIVWLISYLFVRGAQGHAFYLGLSLLLLWEYAVEKTAPSATGGLTAQIQLQFSGAGSDVPSAHVDYGSLAGVSLTIGISYYLLAWGLDRSGRRGAGVVFALVGFPAIAVGIAALAPSLKQVGTGFVLLVVGVAIAYYGARYDRRFTTWIWTVGAAGGAVLILTKIVTGSGTAIGIWLIVLGTVFVLGGWLLAKALREPDDVVVTPVAATPGTPG